MLNLGNPNGLSNADQTKDTMHPQDMRNMIIFFIIAAVLYFTYDAMVLKPQMEAIKARSAAEQQLAEDHGEEALAQLKGEAPIEYAPRAQALEAQTVAGGRVQFENDEIKGSISLKGGRFDDLALKDYFETLDKQDNVALLTPKGAQDQRTIEHGWVSSDKNIKVPNNDTIWSVRGNQTLTQQNPVTLVWNNGQGFTFEREITLDEHFMFTVKQRVVNNSGREATLYPYGILAQRGTPKDYHWMWVSYEGPVGFIGEELHQPGYDDMRKEKKLSYAAETGWIGITEKYWMSALVPPQNQNVKYNYTFSGSDEKDKANRGLYQADYLGAAVTLPAGQTAEVESRFFTGAKKVLLLQKYEKEQEIHNIDLAVDFGWFWFFTYPFFYALHYLGQAIGNMGIAIIILTVLIRGAVFPLTNTSYRSFAKMKKVGPETAKLREKYGDDKQQLQKELIAMYAREGVNPMAGCLPILLQIPIFFALYKVFFITIELRHAPFFGWIHDLSAPDPTSVFNLFGLVPWDPPAFLMIGVWPCLMLVAMSIQRKLNPPPQDQLQRDIARYMPFIFAFMMSRFAAGLVIYWTLSAFIGVIQQIIIMRSMNVPIHLFGESEEEEEAQTKGVDVHPLAEMAEDEVEKALFGEEGEGGEESGQDASADQAAPKKISPPKKKKSKKKK